MVYKLENEVRAVLDEIAAQCKEPQTKQDIRNVMATQKWEVLQKKKKSFKAIERKALKLLSCIDYRNIEPTLTYCEDKNRIYWTYFRVILSSAPYTGGPGRVLPFFCIDRRTGGILGITELRSDLLVMKQRDQDIEWSRKDRFVDFKMNCIASMATCVASQPFGLLTGGKYIASSILAYEIIRLWSRRYGDPLAAITTTSLYGRSSQYNRLKEWKYLGLSEGYGTFHINKKQFSLMKRFLRVNYLLARTSGSSSYAGKWDILNKICGTLRYKRQDVGSCQPRGIYIAYLGKKARKYLCGKIKNFQPDKRHIEDITEWWLNRWYKMRLEKKIDEIRDFKPYIYSVDYQIHQCEEMMCATSRDSVVPGVQPGEGGASPTVALLTNEEK